MRLLCVLIVSLASIPALGQPAGIRSSAEAAPVGAGDGMIEAIRWYQTDRNGVSRFYDLPWSEERFDRLQALHGEWQDRLGRIDFDALDQQGRIDYILLRGKLTAELARLELDRRRLREIEAAMPFRQVVQRLELARWSMQPPDSAAAGASLAAIPDQVKKARERVERGRKAKKEKPAGSNDADAAEEKAGDEKTGEKTGDQDGKAANTAGDSDAGGAAKETDEPIRLTPSQAQRAAGAVSEIRGTLRTWFSFYDGYRPEFSWWVKKPYEEAAKALDDYAKFLREEVAGQKGKDDDPLVGDAIGAEALEADLAAEMIAYSPRDLIAIGEREFAWCESEMRKAAAEMGFGEDWKAALARVKADHVPPGQQDDLVAEQSRFAIAWLKERDLVTIPPLCEETWRLTMISPQQQKTLPFAAYGGQNMMVAYPTDAMGHDDKLMSMRGNNRHFSRIVTPHELIPGHHLQGFMAQRHRAYRGLFSTPFLVEGWALYWEMTLWEMGYPRTPEERIGMLFWRMHRAARIIVSLKFHLGEMTPAEMIDFLVDRVGHERFGATSEVRRFIGGSYSPLYQCGYMIGGLQFRAMRRELVDSGRMTDKQFHDAILTYGPIPVGLIRAGMMNLPLRPDSKGEEWRFGE